MFDPQFLQRPSDLRPRHFNLQFLLPVGRRIHRQPGSTAVLLRGFAGSD
jgi:hypothetical protein